jgi:hypothetical protein
MTVSTVGRTPRREQAINGNRPRATVMRLDFRAQQVATGCGIDGNMMPFLLESSYSIWVFDSEHMRFCRILKGVSSNGRPVVTGWRSYFGLGNESWAESFVVTLNPEGTRFLRAGRHTDSVKGQTGLSVGRMDICPPAWDCTPRGSNSRCTVNRGVAASVDATNSATIETPCDLMFMPYESLFDDYDKTYS